MPPSLDGPDFPSLLAAALANRHVVPLEVARTLLGSLLDEASLDQHTLLVWPDGEIGLWPTTWIRLILRAREMAAG
jgi:hypothetical protein